MPLFETGRVVFACSSVLPAFVPDNKSLYGYARGLGRATRHVDPVGHGMISVCLMRVGIMAH